VTAQPLPALLPPALWLAALVPSLLAINLPPSPTVFNQAAAWATWALVATYGMRAAALPLGASLATARSLTAALGLVALAALASSTFGHLPFGLGVGAAVTIVAAAFVAALGASLAPTAGVPRLWAAAWLAAGLASAAIALIQVFAPEWADGHWIARGYGGRAVGNVRQPNHLASLLLMGAVAVIPLVESGALGRTVAQRALAALSMALLIGADMLTGSRTGMVGVLFLAAWGLFDRRLGRFSRGLLIAAPLLYGLAWQAGAAWSASQAGPALGVAARVGTAELTSGRFTIWGNALAMIAAQPLVGVGFGEFNLAWTLTPFAQRWPEFFDHTHNLPLQIVVELGVPLGFAVLGLLLWALASAARRAWAADGENGVGRRAAFVMVALMGLHSLLEYPLWYAHFLFPTAFAWGLCLGALAPSRAADAPHRPWPLALGLALAVGVGAMLWDYQRVTAIFSPADDTAPLEARIAAGQRSWLFAHHADYARITTFEDSAPPALADFRRATHYLLDGRLLAAWARAYERAGDVQRARWIADRLRELRPSGDDPFLTPCADPSVAVKPFQCTPATVRFTWRDFVVR
jgi:O-antigen ligase